jgi:gliding motility-associated-like protein
LKLNVFPMRLLLISIVLFFLVQPSFAQVQILAGSDTLQVCAGSSISLEAEGADLYEWSPASILNTTTGPAVIATPVSSGYIYVSGTTDDVVSTDSVFLQIISADLEIQVSNIPSPLCEGLPVTLNATSSSPGGNFMWYTGNALQATGNSVQVPSPRGGIVRLEYQFDQCVFIDSVSIDVIEFGVPAPSFADTTVCQGQPLRLASATGSVNTTYTWTPEEGLSGTSIPNPIATPDDTTTYKLVYSSANGECRDSFEITVRIIPIELELDITDPVLLCEGDSIVITARINGDESGLTWGPNDGVLSALTGRTVVAKPDFSNFYFARYEWNGCVLIDSFFIRVDSVPPMPITTIVQQADYCPGEIVVFLSPLYNALLYPDITHEWTPQDATLVSDPSFYNLTIETSPGERTYVRTTTNGGCIVRDSVTIIVKDPQISVTPIDTILCPGQTVQLRILNEVEKIEWSPPTGLSCSDCPDPIATAMGNRVYRVSGEVEGCPAETQVIVRSFPLPIATLGLDPDKFQYVLGDRLEVFITTIPSMPPGTPYTWTFNGRMLTEMDTIANILLDQEVNTITARFITQDGCPIEVSRIIPAVPPVYRIPNAFTPNSDQINDAFQVYLEGNVEVVSMEIYNRWGQLMFRGNDNTGWDGRFNGAACPPEVYAYKITIRLGNGDLVQEKGDLTLLR